MIKVTLHDKSISEQLKLLRLPPKKRQRLVWRAAENLRKIARSNNLNQRDWNGAPWPKRKRGNRKMLRGLSKLLVIHEPTSAWPELFIRFDKGAYRTRKGKDIHAGVIASGHQNGMTVNITAAQVKNGSSRKGKPATKHQARKLRALGYKRPGKRKGQYRSASLGWITENLNYAQAGLIIRKLQGDPAKTSWQIRVPARPFLGANAQQREQAFARALQSIDYGWDINKQDIKRK